MASPTQRQFRSGGAVRHHRASITSPDGAVRMIRRLTRAMKAVGYRKQDLFAIRVAVDEALVNALEHGHGGDRSLAVRVVYHVNERRALVRVRDQGPGFDPDAVPDPLAPENIERPSGRGLFLMQSYMSWVRHNSRGNGVTLCKKRSAL